MADQSLTKRFICAGDIISLPIDNVINKSTTTATGVTVNVTPPIGVSFSSAQIPDGAGTYNSSTNVWTIGTLKPGQSYSAQILWQVDDDCYAPFIFNLIANHDSVCIDGESPEWCVSVDGLTCCDIGPYTYTPIKTVTEDYTPIVWDNTILVDASANMVTITLPDPATMYWEFLTTPRKSGGKELYIRAKDLTNAIVVSASSGKIVEFETVAAAGSSFAFSLVGQTLHIHTDGTDWYVKSV